MTTTTITFETTTNDPSHRWGPAKVAGLAYVGAWVVGLTAFGTGPATSASDREIAHYFATHSAISAAQSLLIHGVAAAALATVLVAMRRNRVATSTAMRAGFVGVGLSLVQCGLDLWRSFLATGTTTATLAHSIDRIDGLKMLAFAVMIAASVHTFRDRGLVGPKMAIVGRLAAPALVVSSIAYATATQSLMASAELSLVLLLTCVGYAGVALNRLEH